MLYNKILLASNGVPESRLNQPRKAVSPATGIPTIHAVLTKLGLKVPFKNELMLAYGTAWKMTDIKGTVVAQPTKRKCRVHYWGEIVDIRA